MKYVGLDISGSTIGITIINNGKYSYAYYKPSKTADILTALNDATNELSIIIGKKPDYIGIEKPVEFMNGASSSKTIIKCNVFAYTIATLLQKEYQVTPEFVHVATVRAFVKRKVDAKVSRLKKEEIPNSLNKILPKQLPKITTKYTDKETKELKEKIAPETYDISDSAAIAVFIKEKVENPSFFDKKKRRK